MQRITREEFNEMARKVLERRYCPPEGAHPESEEEILQIISEDADVTVQESGAFTIAVIQCYDNVMWTGAAKRNPRDEHSPEIGERVALQRALDQVVEFYNRPMCLELAECEICGTTPCKWIEEDGAGSTKLERDDDGFVQHVQV